MPQAAEQIGVWSGDWAWGIALGVVCVAFHVVSLSALGEGFARVAGRQTDRYDARAFVGIVCMVACLAVLLHGTEAVIWALAYWWLDALPDFRSAMLFSLGAMTTYGSPGHALSPHWQLLGAFEALNGIILFGLTTALMFALIMRISPFARRWQ